MRHFYETDQLALPCVLFLFHHSTVFKLPSWRRSCILMFPYEIEGAYEMNVSNSYELKMYSIDNDDDYDYNDDDREVGKL